MDLARKGGNESLRTMVLRTWLQRKDGSWLLNGMDR